MSANLFDFRQSVFQTARITNRSVFSEIFELIEFDGFLQSQP